ncbi:nitroreductase family protein [Streptomyces pseudogriseolus]|uniref:nitroreductase family protein n=1 Tax=Streptomyces pseudogriseolus TaxID=36817 RepID=UPI003FA1D5FF
MRGVLDHAQTAPSNCNTQPWTVHVVSGTARERLSKELLQTDETRRACRAASAAGPRLPPLLGSCPTAAASG